MTFLLGHKFYKGGEKSWFKKGQIPHNLGKRLMIVCKNCTNEFRTFPSSLKRKNIRFCSIKCKSEAAVAANRRDKKCLECNNVIMRKSTLCRSCANKGERSPGYVDGRYRKKYNETYLLRRTKLASDWRKSIFEKDNYTCQKCKVRGGNLQADHIKSWALYPELRFELSNGQALCISCHTIKTKNEIKYIWAQKRAQFKERKVMPHEV